MATLQQLLAEIERSNKARFKPSTSHIAQAPKGSVAPSYHSGGVVNPKTSKGSTEDGGHHKFGILGALASDVEQTVTGIPGGVIQTIHDPIGTIKAVGADYKRRYSPLLSGDFGKFAKETEAHPLAPLLDLATIATAGGGAVAKVGQSARVAATIRDSAIASESRAAAKLAADTAPARKTVAALTKKVEKVKVDRKAAGARASNMSVEKAVRDSSMKAFKKHSDTISKIQEEIDRQSHSIKEATAATTKAQKEAPLPAHIGALVNLQKITHGGYRYIAADKHSEFKNIEVAQSSNPVKRLRQNLGINVQERVLPQQTPIVGLAARAKKAANLQRDTGANRLRFTQEAVKRADVNMAKVAGKDEGKANAMAVAAQGLIDGVAPKDYARVVKDTRSTADEIAKSKSEGVSAEEHHALTDTIIKPHLADQASQLYRAANQYMQKEALKAGRIINPIHLQHDFKDLKASNPKEVDAIVRLQRAHEAAATHAMEQDVKNGVLKHDEASVQAVLHTNLARAAKGQAPRTFEETKAAFEKAGLPVPSYNPDVMLVEDAGKRAGRLTESTGALYKTGKRVQSPMNIVLRHELASKATDLKSAHDLMLSAARHIPAGHSLPRGYVWVNDSIAKDVGAKQALFNKSVEDGHPIGADYYKLLESQKRPDGGYAIRKDVAQDLVAGRKAMSAARADSLNKGITAWKYLVLTRPAFLVHNVLSNQAMYHLKNGWNFAAFHRMQAAFKSGAFEEHHGAEGATFAQDVVSHPKGKISKAVHIFYKLTGQHEHWLRQLTAYETARKMPAVRAELRALKGGKYEPAAHGGRTMFHEAYNRAVAKNPHIRDLVTRNMDDTLGNYRYYTQQERALKNISPFYGWERHSVRNMVRMMEDNPATMAMLTQIGMVGQKKFNKDFGPGMPDFVKSYVQDSYIQTLAQHLGLGDKVSMYDFNSTNPWTTAVDVGKAVGGDKSALINNLGPLVTGPLETLTGKNALTGAPSNSRFDKTNPVLGGLDRIITSTPPVTLYDALTSQKNEKKKMIKSTDRQVVAQQLGADFRNADKAKLKTYEKQRTTPRDKYGNPIKKKKKANPFYQ